MCQLREGRLADAIPSSDLNLTNLALKRRFWDSKLRYRITDLERSKAGNQVFFNGFSKVIKCVCAWMLPA